MNHWSIGLMVSLGAGILCGVAGGSFAVRGATPDYIRLAEARSDTLEPWRGRYVPEPRAVDASEYAPRARSVAYDPVVADCQGCSEYELGYRWAASGAATSTADCEAYSWSYERGCIAWLREGRDRGT
ncbi:hypothetical protein ACFB49_11660 [Sphingomonas sp. DBB INV C78]|uniref:hypothetical protein n=1 Tax=Sphingomonas sp. DBB INV C78 TaxID=3349434 RepID=UPI0036D41ADE